MPDKEKHINLIFKYLAKETNAEENNILTEWINESEENKFVFKEFQKAWIISGDDYLSEINAINVNEEWGKFKAMSGFDDIISLNPKPKKHFSFARIAAVITLLVITSVAAIYIFRPKQEIIYAGTETVESELPDGSIITVNKNSSLTYSNKFNKKNREIELEGDAFFEVEKDDLKPFIIDAQTFFVEVLGTKFYVNTEFNNRKVVVQEGTVAVYQFKDKHDKVILHAGEEIKFDTKENKIRKIENTDINYLSWKTKLFNYNNQKLETIFKDLENVYNIDFQFINPELKKCRLTVSFENQDIDQILNVLKATFDQISFRKNNNTILVDGESCNSYR